MGTTSISEKLTQKLKPVKIKLSDGDKRAQGMYILLKDDEIKFNSQGITQPPNRKYKIEIAVEAMFKNERCRGKKTFKIAMGTSIVKAVESLIPNKNQLIQILKDKGTLKVEKLTTENKSKDLKTLNDCFEVFISNKSINKKPNTVRVYKVNYNTHIKPHIGSCLINDINEETIQTKIINQAINDKKAPNTIKGLKRILKPLLEFNDVLLNWKKIILPETSLGKRKYNKSKEETDKIVNTLLNYNHKIANGVFKFLLTGRRINEVLYLEHENINYQSNEYLIPAKFSKTNKDFTFKLTPLLINAVIAQKTRTGRIFRIESRQMLEHFKNAMRSIGVYDMVLHDIRSLVAQTALDNGADIYDVSKMLGHQKVSTTEASYIEGGANQALKAQKVFERTLKLNSNEIIDVEIIVNKHIAIKKLFPDVSDELIEYCINLLEKKLLKK